jgi:hypothetical protein
LSSTERESKIRNPVLKFSKFGRWIILKKGNNYIRIQGFGFYLLCPFVPSGQRMWYIWCGTYAVEPRT